MLDLITGFSGVQILTFVILFTLAVKGAWDLVDFFKGKYKEKFNKDHQKIVKEDDVMKQIKIVKEQHNETLQLCENLDHKLDSIVESIGELKETVDHLTNSDMHDIKQFIVREYHKFVDEQKQIDDYSLDCILIRYEDYKAEGGNSYIHTLVEEIKKLPKHPPV